MVTSVLKTRTGPAFPPKVRARHKFNGLDRKIQPIFVSTPRRDHSVTKVRPACDWPRALASPLPLLLSCASRDLIVRDVLDQLLDTTTEVGTELVQHVPRRVVPTVVGKLGEGHPVHSGCRSDLDERNDPVLPKFFLCNQLLEPEPEHDCGSIAACDA